MEKTREQENGGRTRYAVATLLLTGGMLSCVVRGMLSVAIVAMVKTVHHPNNTDTLLEDVCPDYTPYESSDKNQDGPYDWDEQVQGEMLASFFYGHVATQFVGGWATDKFGGRVVLGPAVFLSGVFSILSPPAANIHQCLFMALRALQGIFSVTSSAGNLLCMSLSGLLVDHWGWASVFYVFGVVCVLFIVPWLYFVYDTPEVHPRISSPEKDFIIENRQASSSKQKQRVLSTPWRRIMTSLPFWAAVGMSSSFLWLTNTLLIQLPSYLANVLHFNIKESGFLSSLPYLFGCIFGPVFGGLSSWLCARQYLTRMNGYRIFNGIACIGPAILLLLIVFLGCRTTAIITCLVLTGLLQNAYYGGSVTNLLDLAPNFAGATNGISLTVSSMTGIVAPLLYGAILKGQQTLARWHIVFYISIAMCVLPYLLFLVIGAAEEQTWNRPQLQQDEEIKLTNTENTLLGAPTKQTPLVNSA
ncbi:sialin isoform X2 [Anabrus simplex]|uniref:sialin isoform X2 n=1 Tax=Anabrus simplex TaxID=316456 RepID=UPI0035A3B6BC